MKILLLDIDENGVILGIRGKPLKHRIHYGYYKVRLKDGWYPVHRLLATKFIPNPNNYETVNHKDGNKLNNKLENLEWVSRKDNLYHAMDNGLHSWGRTKIKNNKGEIFNSQADAARTYNISQANINRAIKTGRTCGNMTWSYT